MAVLTTETHPCFNQTILRSKLFIYTHDRAMAYAENAIFHQGKIRSVYAQLQLPSSPHPSRPPPLAPKQVARGHGASNPIYYFRSKPLHWDRHFGGILMNKNFKTSLKSRKQTPPSLCRGVTVMPTSLSAPLMSMKTFQQCVSVTNQSALL